jgi:ferredoxin
MKLKRSNDRKVANLVTKNGKQAAIANTFGLPAGKDYSCPGATSICESVCYAGKLEKLFKGVKTNLLHNWELLRNADMETMYQLLNEMIIDSAALILKDVSNLSLYYSTDDENKKIGHELKVNEGIRLAYLGKTFAVTESTMKELTGKPGAKCPENMKSIPLISSAGSACVSCGLCVYGKADIRFSASKK